MVWLWNAVCRRKQEKLCVDIGDGRHRHEMIYKMAPQKALPSIIFVCMLSTSPHAMVERNGVYLTHIGFTNNCLRWKVMNGFVELLLQLVDEITVIGGMFFQPIFLVFLCTSAVYDDEGCGQRQWLIQLRSNVRFIRARTPKIQMYDNRIDICWVSSIHSAWINYAYNSFKITESTSLTPLFMEGKVHPNCSLSH